MTVITRCLVIVIIINCTFLNSPRAQETFNGYTWGYSLDTFLKKEVGNIIDKGKTPCGVTIITTKGEVGNFHATIEYDFYNSKLIGGTFYFEVAKNINCDYEFDYIQGSLEEKYVNNWKGDKWINQDSIRNYSNYEAMKKGFINYGRSWTNGKLEIFHMIGNTDKGGGVYEVQHFITYTTSDETRVVEECMKRKNNHLKKQL